MKNKTTLLTTAILISMLIVPLSGQNRITRELESYHALSVSGRIDVELISSDAKEMHITSINGQPEEVKVELEEGVLKIKILTKLGNKDVISITLPYTQLTSIEAAAGAKINSARDLQARRLELDASTGGKIELSIVAEHVQAKVTQVSDIILYGVTESQDVTVNTGGNYLAFDLASNDATIRATGGSQAKVRVSSSLYATANTKGYIGYTGEPEKLSVKTSLGGKIVAHQAVEE